jgi:hypothetical protein
VPLSSAAQCKLAANINVNVVMVVATFLLRKKEKLYADIAECRDVNDWE